MSATESRRVQYHYLKSNCFRVVHADGVIGGPTPNGNIHVSFFSERSPIPTMVEHELEPLAKGELKVGHETNRAMRPGIVREVEVGVMMNIDMARALHRWLTEHLAKIDTHMATVGTDTP